MKTNLPKEVQAAIDAVSTYEEYLEKLAAYKQSNAPEDIKVAAINELSSKWQRVDHSEILGDIEAGSADLDDVETEG